MILTAVIKLVNRFINDEMNVNEKVMFYNEFNFNDDKCLSLYLLINVSLSETLIKTAQRDFAAR